MVCNLMELNRKITEDQSSYRCRYQVGYYKQILALESSSFVRTIIMIMRDSITLGTGDDIFLGI